MQVANSSVNPSQPVITAPADPALALIEQLRVDQAVEPIHWWPLSIGWWVLAVIILVAIMLGISLWRRQYKRNAWRRAALAHYRSISQRYLQQSSLDRGSEPNIQPRIQPLIQLHGELVAVIKRAIASAHSEQTIMAQSNALWIERLVAEPFSLSSEQASLVVEGHYLPEDPQPGDLQLDDLQPEHSQSGTHRSKKPQPKQLDPEIFDALERGLKRYQVS